MIDHETAIRRISITLDIELSGWAKQGTRSQGRLVQSSEYIKYGLGEKYLKYRLGENCKAILDWPPGNCT
jgi:hypothetical protein